MNVVIENILSAIQNRTGIVPTAFSSSSINNLPCISFTVYRQKDNAVVESWRLQIRVTAESLEEAIYLDQAIADELCSLGDSASFGALRIQINGGGTLEDQSLGLPQLLTYYDIQAHS